MHRNEIDQSDQEKSKTLLSHIYHKSKASKRFFILYFAGKVVNKILILKNPFYFANLEKEKKSSLQLVYLYSYIPNKIPELLFLTREAKTTLVPL